MYISHSLKTRFYLKHFTSLLGDLLIYLYVKYSICCPDDNGSGDDYVC